MLRSGMLAVLSAAIITSVAGAANAADLPIATKAPAVAAPPATCGSIYDFFLTSCPLSWYGVTVYGTVDVGGGYQTHGAPFSPLYPSGASYLILPMNRLAMWGSGAQRLEPIKHWRQN